MADYGALRLAIDVFHVPSRLRQARQRRLPAGVPHLLLIASGDRAALEQASTDLGRTADIIRSAAAFFVDQVLLCPEADSYRVLGSAPESSSDELRRNMMRVLKCVHPDKDSTQHNSSRAARVSLAWNDIKTLERRAAYDRSLASSAKKVACQGAKTSYSAERRRSRNTQLREALAPPGLLWPDGRLRSLTWLLKRLLKNNK